jgi:hypothetical protein
MIAATRLSNERGTSRNGCGETHTVHAFPIQTSQAHAGGCASATARNSCIVWPKRPSAPRSRDTLDAKQGPAVRFFESRAGQQSPDALTQHHQYMLHFVQHLCKHLDSDLREAESMLKRDRCNADCALFMPVKYQTAIRHGAEAYQEVDRPLLSARAVAGSIALVPNTTYRARDKKPLTSRGERHRCAPALSHKGS